MDEITVGQFVLWKKKLTYIGTSLYFLLGEHYFFSGNFKFWFAYQTTLNPNYQNLVEEST